MAAAEAGDIPSVLRALSVGPQPQQELSPNSIRTGYEIARTKIRNGISEQDAARFLLLGLSPSESIEILARDGFIKGALLVATQHQLGHPENEQIKVGRVVISDGFDRARPRIRNGYSEGDAVNFLALGLTPSESAMLLARNGFITGTLSVVNDFVIEGLQSEIIAAGYENAKGRIRDGYSEVDAAKFVTLSSNGASFFPSLAQDGFLVSAYLVKMALGIEQRLSDAAIDSCLRRLESEPFSGMDSGTTGLLETYDRLVKGEFPTELPPKLMLREIAENPERFIPRLQALIERDGKVMSGRMSGEWGGA